MNGSPAADCEGAGAEHAPPAAVSPAPSASASIGQHLMDETSRRRDAANAAERRAAAALAEQGTDSSTRPSAAQAPEQPA
eukprot:817094-Heterocapsa_arctica.AAC.1